MTEEPQGDGLYDVGYRKPPAAHRFKPGQSGNPGGRPRAARNVSTLLAAALAQRITIREGERTANVGKSEALMQEQENRDKVAGGQGGITIHVFDRFDDPQ